MSDRSYCSSQSSQGDEDVDYEPAFLIVQPSARDRVTAEDDQDLLADTVWFEVRPPKTSQCIYQPFVSARQIEIVRTVLMGKNTPKIELEKFPGPPNPPPKFSDKLSSVRNLRKDRTDSSD